MASYHVAHGTVRPAPAKSIAGASASCAWSKLSEPGKVGEALDFPPTVPMPFVDHAPPAKARTKAWSWPRRLLTEDRPRNAPAPPAVSAPPTTSAFVGFSPLTLLVLSIPEPGSSLTWLPLTGSPWNAAHAVLAVASPRITAPSANSFLSPTTSHLHDAFLSHDRKPRHSVSAITCAIDPTPCRRWADCAGRSYATQCNVIAASKFGLEAERAGVSVEETRDGLRHPLAPW